MLVSPAVFKTDCDVLARQAGSIPVHLRQNILITRVLYYIVYNNLSAYLLYWLTSSDGIMQMQFELLQIPTYEYNSS